MDNLALAALACPHCGEQLRELEGRLACTTGHSFDVARQGHVNLLRAGGRAYTVDTAEMVAARTRFLDSGAFDAVSDSAVSLLMEHIRGRGEGVGVDVGAGTGWLLARLLDAMPEYSGVAIDISKYAARRSAKANGRIVSVISDAWATLPVRDNAAAFVVSFFAPRNAEEFHRILAPGGCLLVISPQPDHLAQLVGPLSMVNVDPDKAERIEHSFGELFELVDLLPISETRSFDHDLCRDAALMGPSAHHTAPQALEEALRGLPNPVSVTVAVEMRLFVPRL